MATARTSVLEYTVPTAKSRSRNERSSATVATIWATPAAVTSGQNRAGAAGTSWPSTPNHTSAIAQANGVP